MSTPQPDPTTDGPLPTEIVHLGEDDPMDLSFSAVIGFVLRHLRVLILGPFFGGAVGIVLGLLFFRSYTAESEFVPENGSQGALGTYAALAASAGITLPGASAGQSPPFYVALIKSQATLRQLAESRFTFVDDGDSVDATLVELYGIELPTYHRTILAAVKLLNGQVQVSADPLTGVVTLQTTAESVPLAEKMNRRLLDLIDQFNDDRRRRVASAERVFVEGRLKETEQDVNAAADSVRIFLERNRGFENSPQLAMNLERLRRNLSLHQSVYTGLAQSLENSRIEEVRNTPQITIITAPEGTADRSRLLKYIIMFAGLGGIIALMGAFGSEWLARERARRPEDFRLLGQLHWRQLYQEIVGRRGAGAR